ncbi:MAG: glyoxylate/hydroxypyruvate reductase A [Dokdonella sp.]
MTQPINVVICTAKEQDVWRDALAECLPEANVYVGLDAAPSDYAVVWNPPPGFFERQQALKALFSLGAGVNGLLAMPSLPADVPLIRMEDVGMAAQMEEYALYVALRQFRAMPKYEQAQADQRWSRLGMRTREEFGVGVLGLGVLGGAVARSLAAFGFSVSGWSRSAKAVAGVTCESGADGLDKVLARSELLLLMLPVTRETTGLIDHEKIAKLPAGASIANLSRGELIDDANLLDALDSGHIAQAYLDVFNTEPLPAEHRYWTHSRVHITPHIAALTPHAIACHQVAEKIRKLEAGQAVTGVVDRQHGY